MGTAALGRPFFCAPSMFDNLEVKVRRPDMAALVRTPVLPEANHVGPLPAHLRRSGSRSATATLRRLGTVAGRLSLVRFRLLSPCDFSPHLLCPLVLAQPDVDRVTQKVVRRPGQIGDLGDKLWLDPMDARKNERRSEAG